MDDMKIYVITIEKIKSFVYRLDTLNFKNFQTYTFENEANSKAET